MAENQTILSNINIETKLLINISYKERELLVHNNYTNLLYTPKSILDFSLTKKILGKSGLVFIKDLTEKANPILVFTENHENMNLNGEKKEIFIPLKQILPKTKLIENIDGLKKYDSLRASLNNLKKVNSQTINDFESLHNKKIEELYKLNYDSVSVLNAYRTKAMERYNILLSELNNVVKEKNIHIDEESIKLLKEKVNNNANKKSLLANEVFREQTELDIKYEDIIGSEYVCKGKDNGCPQSGTVWGSNPYTTDSNMCRAAFHGGLVGSEGGFFHVKSLGSQTGYTGTTQNGITTTSWQTWDGNSYHKTYLDIDFDISKHNYCGKYKED